MLKMVMDPMGGIVMTNDGNAILREIEVIHPAAKSMLELCRAQDEEVGDGTTSVIVLAGEILACIAPFLEPTRRIHPVRIIAALRLALRDCMKELSNIARPIDIADNLALEHLLRATLDASAPESKMVAKMAIQAVRYVAIKNSSTTRDEADIKQYAKVEKVPGGELEECVVLDGVMFNKDVVHPGMRRRIENPRILLVDCPLEYKKGESQTAMEISRDGDWQTALEAEERQIRDAVSHIVALKPDVLVCEKGVSDLAQHYLVRAGISAVRRVRKTDNNRIARATGATIVNRLEDAKSSDIGTSCGLFEVRKIGDEYYTFLVQCSAPKACTILLRGPSKDILSEVERTLQDAMCVVRNAILDPRLVPGGGASEMSLATLLEKRSRDEDAMRGFERGPYQAVAAALSVIPRTLIQNAGGNAVRTLAELKAKHVSGEPGAWGVDGMTGSIRDMAISSSLQDVANEHANTTDSDGIFECLSVKAQTIKTAIESACMILRVDDIVAGLAPLSSGSSQPQASLQDVSGAQD